ncbi:MAG: hypothetical protein J7J72_08055, partial [Bacteroidales bacterium]|nr:hypothetical protein [Bacteroidales bacterium]
ALAKNSSFGFLGSAFFVSAKKQMCNFRVGFSYIFSFNLLLGFSFLVLATTVNCMVRRALKSTFLSNRQVAGAQV